MKANIGCGYDVKPDWVNIDTSGEDVHHYDITSTKFAEDYKEAFDFALLNHVLCTMNEDKAHEALMNIYQTIKPDGKLHVIDMDILKVFESYRDGRIHDIPISEGSIDDRLCLAISGYGTRESLYTPLRMCKVLVEAGFRNVAVLRESPYDTRPHESLVVEATK